ncbi:hypothetical protein EVAR_35600_1 [Eumeta japonica]|uniref:Uncharacterized protein n=1 Tax=Eumeta variegata TaxID=151549 RepID=A0A4C1WDJ2_EUMVA|nr:hypothetical protein EVAR_35600_1 [Eumeta japonica]
MYRSFTKRSELSSAQAAQLTDFPKFSLFALTYYCACARTNCAIKIKGGAIEKRNCTRNGREIAPAGRSAARAAERPRVCGEMTNKFVGPIKISIKITG